MTGPMLDVLRLPDAPRAIRLNANGRSNLRITRGIFALVTAIGLVAGTLHALSIYRLFRDGRVAMVTVEDKRMTIGAKGSVHREVTYTLALPGYARQLREEPDDCGWFNVASVGGLSPVTYLSDNPAVHEFGRVGASDVRWAIRQMVMGTAVALVIPTVLLVGTTGQVRRERALLGRGRWVEARVVENRPTSNGRTLVRYLYEAERGPRKGSLTVKGSGGERTKPGSTIPCLYLPEESYESVPVADLRYVELV